MKTIFVWPTAAWSSSSPVNRWGHWPCNSHQPTPELLCTPAALLSHCDLCFLEERGPAGQFSDNVMALQANLMGSKVQTSWRGNGNGQIRLSLTWQDHSTRCEQLLINLWHQFWESWNTLKRWTWCRIEPDGGPIGSFGTVWFFYAVSVLPALTTDAIVPLSCRDSFNSELKSDGLFYLQKMSINCTKIQWDQ